MSLALCNIREEDLNNHEKRCSDQLLESKLDVPFLRPQPSGHSNAARKCTTEED